MTCSCRALGRRIPASDGTAPFPMALEYLRSHHVARECALPGRFRRAHSAPPGSRRRTSTRMSGPTPTSSTQVQIAAHSCLRRCELLRRNYVPCGMISHLRQLPLLESARAANAHMHALQCGPLGSTAIRNRVVPRPSLRRSSNVSLSCETVDRFTVGFHFAQTGSCPSTSTPATTSSSSCRTRLAAREAAAAAQVWSAYCGAAQRWHRTAQHSAVSYHCRPQADSRTVRSVDAHSLTARDGLWLTVRIRH